MSYDRLMFFALCTAALLFTTACGETETQVRNVDEDADADVALAAAEPDTAAEAEPEADVEMVPWEGDGIAWSTPEPWTTEDGSGMRFATIVDGSETSDATEIAVTRFPGDVGGVLANVNRWCQQVGAPPVQSEEALGELLTEMEIDGHNALLAEIEGSDNRKIVAIVLPDTAEDQTWFFRISGQTEAVDATIPVLKQVAPTVKLGS
ncbi:MAG: hypothetical protein WD294_10835 [Phycisphaeraceae bacterium]